MVKKKGRERDVAGRVAWFIFALVSLVIISACGPGGIFEDSSERATREGQNSVYEATIHAVQTQAATVIALQNTAEGASIMGTQIIQLGVQNRALEATIEAAALGIFTQPNPSGFTNQPGVGVTPLFPDTSGQFQPTPFPQQALAPTQAFSNNNVNYVQAIMATGVRDEDGCALDSLQSFPDGTQQIYMVATARNIEAGITYYTRWIYNNQVVIESVSWTSDRFYAELCIWFYMSRQDVTFVPGMWTVELIANNLVAISQNFSIEGGAPQSAGGNAVSGVSSNINSSGGGFQQAPLTRP